MFWYYFIGKTEIMDVAANNCFQKLFPTLTRGSKTKSQYVLSKQPEI